MKRRYRALALPAVVLGSLLAAGCSPANEEGLGGQTSKYVPPAPGTPELKGYGDAMRYQTEQAAKNLPASKGQAAAKGQPK